MKDLHITCETRDTAVPVHGVTQCDKIKYCTRTCDTRFGNSAGLPATVLHPNHTYYWKVWHCTTQLAHNHPGLLDFY